MPATMIPPHQCHAIRWGGVPWGGRHACIHRAQSLGAAVPGGEKVDRQTPQGGRGLGEGAAQAWQGPCKGIGNVGEGSIVRALLMQQWGNSAR